MLVGQETESFLAASKTPLDRPAGCSGTVGPATVKAGGVSGVVRPVGGGCFHMGSYYATQSLS